jgi:hypothetical protein
MVGLFEVQGLELHVFTLHPTPFTLHLIKKRIENKLAGRNDLRFTFTA